MTPVAAIRGANVSPVGRAPRNAAAPAARAPAAAQSRALVPLAPIARGDTENHTSPHTRPQADFLAHLIATDGKLPQTRERRRAEPADAIAAYAAGTRSPSRTGRRLVRVA
jgi:hypothetical protein